MPLMANLDITPTLVALQSDCFMKMMSRTATSEGKAVEALFRRLSQTEPENGPEKEYQNFFEPVVVFLSLSLAV